MDDTAADQRLQNLEHRVDRVEQFLPALATKDDLQRATEPLATKEELQRAIDRAMEPLATNEELQRAIQAAVAPLATKEELQALSRRMDMQFETVRDDIQLLATHAASQSTKPRDK